LKHLRHPDLLKFVRILVWNDAPDDYENVSHLLLAQKFHNARHDRVVCPGQNGKSDHLDILLKGSIDDHFRCLPEARVDYFHSGVAKSTSNDLRAAVVSVEARLGNEHTNRNIHTCDVQIIERELSGTRIEDVLEQRGSTRRTRLAAGGSFIDTTLRMLRLTRRELGAVAFTAGTQGQSVLAANSIDAVLRSGLEQRKIPAITATAGTANATIYSGAFGTRDAVSGVPVSLDSIFSIASMTKAITSAAAMQLVEGGRLTLDEPASKHLPELGRLQVLQGFDASGRSILRPATMPVTLRQLLTHTSGFAYDIWYEPMFKFTSSGGDATHVLAFEPGTKWQYGPSTFWAGRLVEAVSGMNLERYFQEMILGPLEMKDTSFTLRKEQYERLVGQYQRQTDGSLMPLPRKLPERPAVYHGDSGLFSTASDYLKFTQMILNRGLGPGKERILQEKTVALMSANGTGQMAAGRLKTVRPNLSNDVDFHPGHDDRYTLGFLMNPEPIPGGRSAGTLAWAGLYNTYYWIDPHRNVCGVVMMQLLPFADRQAVALLNDFQHALYTTRR